MLVFVMIAFPVALVTATATVARTIVGAPEDEVAATMGSADLMVSTGEHFDRRGASPKLPAGSDVVTVTSVFEDVVEDGELHHATLAQIDGSLDDPMFDGLYDLTAGRSPEKAGEAAVNPVVLDVFDVDVGGRLRVGREELTVTGVVRTRDLDQLIAVVGPGTLAARRGSSTTLVRLPDGAGVEPVVARLDAHGVTTRSSIAQTIAADAEVWDGVSLVGGVLALFTTGLIAAAAFVVGARRQLRQLGMVGAIGGEPRHVRAVVWLGGTTVGLAASVAGSGLGVALAIAVHPHLDRVVGRLVGPPDVNVLVVAAAIVMGTAAATVAALAPARSAGKLGVMAALAGRTSPPRPPGRVAGAGIVVVVAAGGVTGWATLRDQYVLLACGLVAMLVGFLSWIPMLVATTGSLASRFPTSVRMAARDAARHGRRTGAAVAAAVIALALPVAVATYSLSEETYERRRPRLGPDMMLIGRSSDAAAPRAADRIALEVERAFPDAVVVPLRDARAPRGPGGRPIPVFAFGAKEVVRPGESTVTAWPLFVADERALKAVHAEDGAEALADGHALVLGGSEAHKGSVRLDVPSRGGRYRTARLPAVAVDSPAYFNESLPRIVVSQATAEELGLSAHTTQHLVTLPRPATGDDLERVRSIVADEPGFFANGNDDYLPQYADARSAVTAASVPLGLAVLAVAVALVTSESRRSHQILVAVGAGPWMHRKIVAATSALLALIAGAVAVPAGILPTMIVETASRAGRPLVVPWATVAIVVVATPLASAAVAGALARTPKLGSLLTPAT